MLINAEKLEFIKKETVMVCTGADIERGLGRKNPCFPVNS